MEKRIAIAYKLQQARKSLKFLWGDKYEDKIKLYKDFLIEYSKRNNLEILKSVMKIVEKMLNDGQDGFSVLPIFAAGVEIIENERA